MHERMRWMRHGCGMLFSLQVEPLQLHESVSVGIPLSAHGDPARGSDHPLRWRCTLSFAFKPYLPISWCCSSFALRVRLAFSDSLWL